MKKDTFTSKYRFKKVRTESIPALSVNAVDTSYSDAVTESPETRMVPVGSYEKEGDMTRDYDQDTMPSYIDLYTNMLSGEQIIESEDHGQVPIKREYPNRPRTIPRETFPFAKHEQATDVEIATAREPFRLINKVDGVVYDLLDSVIPNEIEPRPAIRADNSAKIQPAPKKVVDPDVEDLKEQLKILCEKIDAGTDTDRDLALIQIINQKIYGE